MEIKGITWMENIYHRLEAMCLEVEEVIYQDTVKYVGNQAQKVGLRAKKFYSEVKEDLLPRSCVDPVKESFSDLSLNPYDHNKKPLPSICGDQSLPEKKLDEDRVISHATANASSSGPYGVNSLSELSTGAPKHNKFNEPWYEKSDKLGACRRRIGIKRISQDNHPLNDSSRFTSLSGNRNAKPASSDMSSSRSVTALANVNVMPSSNSDSVCREAVEENEPMATNSTMPSSLKINSSPESLRQNQGISMHESLPSNSSDTRDIEFRGKDDATSDEVTHELIENEEATGSAAGKFESVDNDNENLDKSCVLVEGNKLCSEPQGTPTKMSYKNKICKALTSKLGSTRKHGRSDSTQNDSGGKKSGDTPVSGLMSPSQLDDWELL